MTILPVLQLPEHLRKTLSTPIGKLYVSSGYITGFRVDYCVGDIVSMNQVSDYKVVDSRVMRLEREFEKINCDTYVYNPPGAISLNTLTVLKTMFFKTMCVVGEEDLVVLGIGRDKHVTIAYGQPRVGVVIYKADPFHTLSIIKAFKPTLAFYNSNALVN